MAQYYFWHISLVKETPIVSYADDTIVIFHENSWGGTKVAIQLGIGKIKKLLNEYKLSLNVKKTNYLAFSLNETNRPDYTNHIFFTYTA